MVDGEEVDEWAPVPDPRRKLWCSDHVCWREKCRPIHNDFVRRLEKAREQFKDVG